MKTISLTRGLFALVDDGDFERVLKFRWHAQKSGRLTYAKRGVWNGKNNDTVNVGTKSLLFGVHQFLWHPWTVIRAYRAVHGIWPMFDECLCILVHDWGYWGCANMDGTEGKRHPELGAYLAYWLVFWWYRLRRVPRLVASQYGWEARDRTLYHSSHYARMHNARPSPLYLPDKASILHEPRWFYLLRARLSGEVWEYISNSPFAKLPPELQTPGAWYNWYRGKVKENLCGQSNKQ